MSSVPKRMLWIKRLLILVSRKIIQRCNGLLPLGFSPRNTKNSDPTVRKHFRAKSNKRSIESMYFCSLAGNKKEKEKKKEEQKEKKKKKREGEEREQVKVKLKGQINDVPIRWDDIASIESASPRKNKPGKRKKKIDPFQFYYSGKEVKLSLSVNVRFCAWLKLK